MRDRWVDTSGLSTLRHSISKMGMTKATTRNSSSGDTSRKALIFERLTARRRLTLSGTPSAVVNGDAGESDTLALRKAT
ncbi:MAG: hypothetical protein IIC12_01585 [Proteobacteria bacterium]|nr:hypothetical protein [Pseudomonadota bacterium]